MATAEATSNLEKVQVRRYRPEENPDSTYLNNEKGIMSWLNTRDHKRIGIMFLLSTTVVFLFAGLFALLVRLELWTPTQTFIQANTYNELFSIHGIMMIFMFLVPAVPAILGNFILPIQLGAKDVAFPKLNLGSWYLYIIGSAVVIYAVVGGGIDSGWTFYVPYSLYSSGTLTLATFGIFILGFSSILTGLNFIVTIHKMRAPGISWDKVTLFGWALYANGILQLLATPVLAVTLMLLMMERMLGIGIFDPAMGGDAVLYEHFFWFYSHPAVYIMIVPGFGVVSEVITTFCKKTIFGYWAIAISSLAIAFLSFLVWGHHMFVSGQSQLASMVFSFFTFLIGIPTGIKVFNWLATMYKGSISLKTPMLYILAFFFLFTVGGLTGIVLGTIALDVHLHDTYYVVAHFHFVMVGGMVTAFLAGLHYWWPKMTGKMYNEMVGKIACGTIFLGFCVTFLPQFVMGANGMPRRYYNYIDVFQPFHQVSTVGAFILGAGFIIMIVNLLMSLKKEGYTSANPWNSRALEWQVSSPAPPHNFNHVPVVIHRPYDYHQPLKDFQLGLAQTNGHDNHPEVVEKENKD